MSRDAEHLKLLTIFHFVLAGVLGATGLIFVVHIALGIIMIQAAGPTPPRGGGQASPLLMGWLFLGMGVTFLAVFLGSGILLALAGWNLSRRKRWTFCFVVACLSCLNAPLGTALGVCTILVLNRQSVKDLFAGKIVEPTDPEDEEEDRPAPPGDDDRYYAAR
jgi:hypothetical protein